MIILLLLLIIIIIIIIINFISNYYYFYYYSLRLLIIEYHWNGNRFTIMIYYSLLKNYLFNAVPLFIYFKRKLCGFSQLFLTVSF